MPLVAGDLLEPKGVLAPGMFPGVEDVVARVADYLAAAYVEADDRAVGADDRDRFARAWAYAKAFDALAVRLMSEPMSASIADKGSRAYGSEQLRAAQAAAARYQQEALDLVPIATPGQTARPIPTHEVENRYVF